MKLLSSRNLVIPLAFLTALITPNLAAQSAQPIRTDNRGAFQIYYYQNPLAIAVATTFFVSGSPASSNWRDFLAVTANFGVRGWTICQPESVHFSFDSSTRTKGGKYQADHHLTVVTNGRILLSTDLTLGLFADNHRGGYQELLSLELPFEQFADLARAKDVAMTVGGTRFKLKRKQLAGLLGMLHSIEAGLCAISECS